MSEAHFILETAAEAGIKVGTNGEDLVMIAPLRLPVASLRSFEAAFRKHESEIIALIKREAAR